MSGPTLRELTAPAPGAVAVLEIRGAGALDAAAGLLRGRRPAPGELTLRRLFGADGELLDEALVWVASAERVELHLHGSRPLVERLRTELDLPPPEPGGSIEARAETLLAQAEGEAQARVLLDQAQGALRAELEALLACVPGDDRRAHLRRLHLAGRRARALFEPPRVVLRGPTNAGKSTLFNALLGRERALVDPTPGTTRDAVTATARLGDYRVEWVDTAGEREVGEDEPGQAEVERLGIDLAHELGRRADLVLWLAPAGDTTALPAGDNVRVVTSRADEAAATRGPSLSALADPEGARATVAAVVGEALDWELPAWVAGRAVPFDEPVRSWLERAVGGTFDEPGLKAILTR